MSDYFGYIEAVHRAAAEEKVDEYIAGDLEIMDIAGWDIVHHFENDVNRVVKVELFEQLHTPSKPLATLYLIGCKNGCYRLPTKQERGFLNGKKAVPARSRR